LYSNFEHSEKQKKRTIYERGYGMPEKENERKADGDGQQQEGTIEAALLTHIEAKREKRSDNTAQEVVIVAARKK
jgi:hypothetical protein